MTLIPAAIPFQHLIWSLTGTVDDHGNDPGQLSAPINRMAISVYPMHWRNPHTDPISPDYMSRTETDILIEVENPTLFNKLDQVIVYGVTFEVQGIPADWGYGIPFAMNAYSYLVGGTVHVRRVTSTGVLAG